jgi:E3 ubiquitin-protein ligase HUWE1
MKLPECAQALRNGANNWIEYWDEREEKCFYFNNLTNDRSETQPLSFSPEAQPDQTENVEFRKKRYKLMRDIHASEASHGVHKMEVLRETVLEQTFKHVANMTKQELYHRFQIEYTNEPGIDSGGLVKDWFLLVSRKLVASEEGLFCKTEDKAHNQINMNHFKDDHQAWYKFAGKFIGKAIFDRQIVDVRFTEVMYKHMLGVTVTFDDMKHIDPVFCKSLEVRWQSMVSMRHSLMLIVCAVDGVERHHRYHF